MRIISTLPQEPKEKNRDDFLSPIKKENTQILEPELNWYSDFIVDFLNHHWFSSQIVFTNLYLL